MYLVKRPWFMFAIDRMDNGRHMVRWGTPPIQGCVFRPDEFMIAGVCRCANGAWFVELGGIAFGFASTRDVDGAGRSDAA